MEPSMRLTRCPTRVEKLFRMTSGTWDVVRPALGISVASCVLVHLNSIVGPAGRCVTITLCAHP